MRTACLARTIESVSPLLSPSSETGGAPENQHPPCQPKAPDFSKTKKTIPYPGRNRLHGFPAGGIQSTKRGQKGLGFRPPATPNPASLIRQITTLRIPHTYTHTLESRKSSGSRFRGNLEKFCSGPLRSPPGRPRPLRRVWELGTSEKVQPAVSGTPPVPVQEWSRTSGWEIQRVDSPAVPTAPGPLHQCTARLAPGLVPQPAGPRQSSPTQASRGRRTQNEFQGTTPAEPQTPTWGALP